MEYGFKTKFTDKFIADLIKDKRYLEKGQALFTEQKTSIAESINMYKISNGALSAKKIEEDYFPIPENIDIFISHSHEDLDLAKSFAGMFKNYLGVNCFVDSCLWGSANDLLGIILDAYKHNNSSYSDNELVKKASENVYMILSMALAKTMATSKVFCFIETPNSITSKGAIATTNSPWIYSELVISKLLLPKIIRDINANFSDNIKTPKFTYEPDTKHLLTLSDEKCEELFPNPFITKNNWKEEMKKILEY